MSDYQSFETERLYLKPTVQEDAPFILELLNTPKWLKYIGDRNVRSLEDAQAYIKERITPQFEKLGYSNYTVVRKSDGAKMGSCGLYDREGLAGIDIGFAFFPAYEKKGYAFEAANKVKEIAGKEFKLTLIRAITVQENLGSQRLLEKLGFSFKELIRIPNDEEELMLYEFTG